MKFLKWIYRKLTFKFLLNFEADEPNVDEWKQFLNSFPEAKDDFDLSYYKYLCRMYYFPFLYKFIANMASLVAFITVVPVFLKRKSTIESDENKGLGESYYLLVKSTNVGYEDILPEELDEKYGKRIVINKPRYSEWYLSKDAKKILFRCLIKHPFSFHYNFTVFKEISTYAYLINKYKPNALSVYVNERNVASPLISNMCEKNGIDFVTFMHGDYILQLIQGYMRFTKFYVWDEHYTEMFTETLRCPKEQFEVYTPGKLKCSDEVGKFQSTYKYFGTYYFGAESVERINKIAEVFEKLKLEGKLCKVRPHPRRSNLTAINKAFSDFTIEDPKKISLEESMKDSEHIIALNSTVLLEAYYCGRKVVIDDYSEPEKYENLKNRKYIMIHKSHKLLSELYLPD